MLVCLYLVCGCLLVTTAQRSQSSQRLNIYRRRLEALHYRTKFFLYPSFLVKNKVLASSPRAQGPGIKVQCSGTGKGQNIVAGHLES